MSKSLIRKNQLHPDITDLVGEYGSGYFISLNSGNLFISSIDNLNENTVKITGNQTISGTKTFSTRPQVNGSGVLLSGEIFAQLPNTIVYTTGNQTINGTKDFNTRPQVNGTGVLLSGEATAGSISNVVYTTGNQTISGIKTFQNLNTINGNTSFGIYNYNLYGQNQYLKQEEQLSDLANTVSGIRNNDIVNFYFEDINPSISNFTLKVNPGVLVDYSGQSKRNIIKFPDNSIYSGKAVRKIRYNSTIGNGYESFNLTNASTTENPAIIRPKTRRLETFYDINVPSGGGIRALLFNTPTSFPFVQGTCMNLRFNFEADNTPCVISGYSNNNQVFLITGANYSFIQKERVILIDKGGPDFEFKHW